MPQHLGQINFYLEALDRDVKKQNENPSIGILLCKDIDKEVIEYALSRSLSPTMVSEYKTKLPNKKTLQKKLHELFEKSKGGGTIANSPLASAICFLFDSKIMCKFEVFSFEGSSVRNRRRQRANRY